METKTKLYTYCCTPFENDLHHFIKLPGECCSVPIQTQHIQLKECTITTNNNNNRQGGNSTLVRSVL